MRSPVFLSKPSMAVFKASFRLSCPVTVGVDSTELAWINPIRFPYTRNRP